MKYVIALSGGIDSTTLLAILSKEKDAQIYCIGFKYPSKHNEHEIKAAFNIAENYKVSYHVVDTTSIFNIFKSNLLLGQGVIPKGHYKADNMKLTVVPGRNTIFASILMGYAQSIEADYITLGIHKGDHAIYPDCRPLWLREFGKLCYDTTEKKIMLQVPLLYLDKSKIVQIGLNLNAPYHLTRTCYTNQINACGECGSCIERLEAFAANNTKDPIAYGSK